ncbi:MAG: aspartate carbamoyltransferase catalytic subunit [Ignavibacteria bacterium]|nr:aspartate carbamoyltransferase catalytic subunit [Ignavibacteria bacterium]
MENTERISLNNLLQSSDLLESDIYAIFKRAKYFLDNYKTIKKFKDLEGISAALAFFEPSTRTKLSFELACKRLSADTFSFQSSGSSLSKGESLIDTLRTIEAMGVNVYIVRHQCSGVPIFLQQNTKGIVINAGDGKHDHPTQALLDSFTLYQYYGKLNNIRVCIVGDIIHSRVARANLSVLQKLGVEVAISGPGTLIPNKNQADYKVIDKIEDAIDWADAIILLRLQRERMESGFLPTLREYSQYMGLSYSLFSKKPGLIVLHPGPVNYGIELDYNVSAFPNVLIQSQVKHGLFIRMSLLSLLVQNYREPGG